MGSLFRSPRVVSASNLSPGQAGLHSPLRQLLESQIGDQTDYNDFQNVLNSGSSSTRVRAMSDQLLSSLLGFSSNLPGVDQQRLNQGAEQAMAELLPRLIGLQLTGIGRRNEAKLAPAAAAIRFATGSTRAPVAESAGPGWGLLNAAITGAAAIGSSGSRTPPPSTYRGQYSGISREDFYNSKGY